MQSNPRRFIDQVLCRWCPGFILTLGKMKSMSMSIELTRNVRHSLLPEMEVFKADVPLCVDAALLEGSTISDEASRVKTNFEIDEKVASPVRGGVSSEQIVLFESAKMFADFVLIIPAATRAVEAPSPLAPYTSFVSQPNEAVRVHQVPFWVRLKERC